MEKIPGNKNSGVLTEDVRACTFFLLAAFVRLIGVGIFNTYFNIYFLENGFSENFLGVFLAVGNAAMALASYPTGVLIDRVSKKKMLILFTLINLTCYTVQIFLTNQAVLLFTSVIFGISFIGLVNIAGPFLYGFSKIGKKMNLYVIYRTVNIISVTIGAILAGTLQSIGFTVHQILIFSLLFGLISLIPQLLSADPTTSDSRLPDPKPVRENQKQTSPTKRRNNLIRTLGLIILFGAIGFSPMVTNYINLYLQKRISANLDSLAYGYAGIYFFSGFLMLRFAKYKIRGKKIALDLVGIGLFIIAIYVTMYMVPVFIVQIIGITLLICVFELSSSVLNDYVFTISENSDHGKNAGMINLVSNFTETFGIYLCGRILGAEQYEALFLFSAVPIVAVLIIAGLFYFRSRQPLQSR